jgi:hypothetical protein
MKITREAIIVSLIFLVVFSTRLLLSFSAGGIDYDSYFTLRQADSIKESGLPIFNDDLSFSGRFYVFPVLFYYLVAFAAFFFPVSIAAVIVSSICFSALIPLTYLVSRHITKNKIASLISAFFAGFVPVFYQDAAKSSPFSLALVLLFLASYFFLKHTSSKINKKEDRFYLKACLFVSVILLLTDISIFLFILGLLVYMIIFRLENKKILDSEIELFIFLSSLSLWFYILLYKKALFLHGIRIVWANLPLPLISSIFKNVAFFEILYLIGFVPVILGVYTIYQEFFRTKNNASAFFISFSIVGFFMLWFKLITYRESLLFLSFSIIILSSLSIKGFLVSISKTKFAKFKPWLVLGIIFLFILTSLPVFDSSKAQVPSQKDIKALEWIKENTPSDSSVLGLLQEGFLINQVADRKNIYDKNFLFIKNSDDIYEDLEKVYSLRLKLSAIRILDKHDVDYVLLSKKAQEQKRIEKLFYAEDDCFEKVYEDEAIVYEFKGCRV